MTGLEGLDGPESLRDLDDEQMVDLAEEIRQFLVEKVSRTGGHLGPNLGVVELTLALHRVFQSPQDVLLWDTGHQTYVHKIVTGRASGFDRLRQRGGLSGYPSRSESPHDVIENSHASTALSYADGLARGFELTGEASRRKVVAVVGDGSLTGGMAWEALNNIAGSDRQVIIVVNDNTRSYSPTIGGLARHLSTLRTTRGYEGFMKGIRRLLTGTPMVGSPVFGTLHGVKRGVKDIVAPQGMFEDLGIKYLGPVDGHDMPALEHILGRAAAFPGPVIVHAITSKGRGYLPAEQDLADHLHGIGVIDPKTGKPAPSKGTSWTSVFSEELVRAGEADPRLVAVTAAMMGPTGLDAFAEKFPDRVVDVGIAEQHAVTSSVGMSLAGVKPVIALYATFLNRAFDQLLMDAALHGAPISIMLDRAGVTGDDGASHNGMWDLSLMQIVPNMRIAAPRDEPTLRAAVRESLADMTGPSAVRYPKGKIGPDIPAVATVGDVDVLYRSSEETGRQVLLVAVGSMVGVGLDVASRLHDQGIGADVVDPRWVAPVSTDLIGLAAGSDMVVVIEDNGRVGGVGARVSLALQDAGVDVPLRAFGVPQRFLEHAKRPELLAEMGLTGPQITGELLGMLLPREHVDSRRTDA